MPPGQSSSVAGPRNRQPRAEQGFARAFSGGVLDAIARELKTTYVILVGSRGTVATQERELRISWRTTAAPHVDDAVLAAARRTRQRSRCDLKQFTPRKHS
jgi:hypothetical protein